MVSGKGGALCASGDASRLGNEVQPHHYLLENDAAIVKVKAALKFVSYTTLRCFVVLLD
jgi:hypothetical protein